MGLGSSKAQSAAAAASVPVPEPTPAVTAAVVEEMCKEAYEAGVGDADVYHTAQREAMQRQDAALGVGACLMAGWLAFVYGRSHGVRMAEEAAGLRLDAQQALLDKVNSDLVAIAEEKRSLLTVKEEQQVIIAQQRSELQRAARQRKTMQQSMQALKRRNASVRKQLRGLTTSLNSIQRQMYAGMVGAGVLLLAVVWGTRPLRRGRHGLAPPPPPLPPPSPRTEEDSEQNTQHRHLAHQQRELKLQPDVQPQPEQPAAVPAATPVEHVVVVDAVDTDVAEPEIEKETSEER